MRPSCIFSIGSSQSSSRGRTGGSLSCISFSSWVARIAFGCICSSSFLGAEEREDRWNGIGCCPSIRFPCFDSWLMLWGSKAKAILHVCPPPNLRKRYSHRCILPSWSYQSQRQCFQPESCRYLPTYSSQRWWSSTSQCQDS